MQPQPCKPESRVFAWLRPKLGVQERPVEREREPPECAPYTGLPPTPSFTRNSAEPLRFRLHGGAWRLPPLGERRNAAPPPEAHQGPPPTLARTPPSGPLGRSGALWGIARGARGHAGSRWGTWCGFPPGRAFPGVPGHSPPGGGWRVSLGSAGPEALPHDARAPCECATWAVRSSATAPPDPMTRRAPGGAYGHLWTARELQPRHAGAHAGRIQAPSL